MIRRNDRDKVGSHVKKILKLKGGHLIFKWCFPNPTSPPSLIKNERSIFLLWTNFYFPINWELNECI